MMTRSTRHCSQELEMHLEECPHSCSSCSTYYDFEAERVGAHPRDPRVPGVAEPTQSIAPPPPPA
eukprot:6873036-Prorocentrum_lima.AAC.1